MSASGRTQWRIFMDKANSALLAVLLAVMYFVGIGLARLCAAVFARGYLSCPPAGWGPGEGLREDLESAKRQS